MIPRANRIVRSRRKGSKLAAGAIYVGRPTVWGNPFTIGQHGNHARCTILFRSWIHGGLGDLLDGIEHRELPQ